MTCGPSRTVSVSAMRSPQAVTMIAEKTASTRFALRSSTSTPMRLARRRGSASCRNSNAACCSASDALMTRSIRHDSLGGQPADLPPSRHAGQDRDVGLRIASSGPTSAGTVSSSMATSSA